MKKNYALKSIFISFAGLLIFAFTSCQSSNVSVSRTGAGISEKIKVDIKNVSPINDGVFEGWGTSLCWWGNRLGGNEKLSNEAVDLFFTMDKGIGLNIIRYNIGGGDDPSHNHIVRSDSAMPGFWKNVDESGNFEYDWTADGRQRNVLKKIAAKVDDDLIVEFFSNSPPYFMTKSGCSSGNKPGFADNIKEDKYEDFAEYLAEVTYNLQKIDGIKVASLEPMNEPRSVSWSAFSGKQEGCHVSKGKNQSKLLILTRQALDKRGLQNIIVSGSDEYGSGNQSSSITAWSKDAKNSLGRVNTHTYWGENYKKILSLAEKYEKDLWISETDGPDSVGKNNGQMGPALGFAKKILKDMSARPSAWLIWQSVASYISAEPFNGLVDGVWTPDFSKGFWGVVVADFVNEKILLSKKYYAFGQFTKYIRPGSYVIYIDSENYIASYNPKLNQVSIVCVNSTVNEKNCTFDLSSFVNGWNKITAIRTSGMDLDDGENMGQVDMEIESVGDGMFTASLIPNSITTFVIDGVKKY